MFDPLVQEMRLDLGLRSEFEAALRSKLMEFRANPRPGSYSITVSLDITSAFTAGVAHYTEAEVSASADATPRERTAPC
jgi:hypothetical protein